METIDTVKDMRDWLSDIAYALPDDIEVADLFDDEVIDMVANAYDGGVGQFIADTYFSIPRLLYFEPNLLN